MIAVITDSMCIIDIKGNIKHGGNEVGLMSKPK